MEITDDYEHLNKNIIYITENIPTKEMEVKFFEQFLTGCTCSNECKDPKHCICLEKSGARYVQNQQENDKDVQRNEDNNTTIEILNKEKPIYECNSSCKCPKNCGNRLVQFGPKKHLEIKQCSKINNESKGLGLYTRYPIKKGSFICEYAGEIINEDECIKRLNYNLKHNLMNYILCVNEKFGSNIIRTIVDPSKFGNIGRYLNHSCESNCELIVIRINSTIPKICVFAKFNIDSGSELNFDYGMMGEEISNQVLTKCLCNTKLCKGYMPFHKFMGK